jgi:hypothetical protein
MFHVVRQKEEINYYCNLRTDVHLSWKKSATTHRAGQTRPRVDLFFEQIVFFGMLVSTYDAYAQYLYSGGLPLVGGGPDGGK